MVTFDLLLDALYRIQAASDPNESRASIDERMAKIFDIACEMMEKSGFQPFDRGV